MNPNKKFMMVGVSTVAIFLLITSCTKYPIISPPPVPDSNWWMFQTELSHTGHLRGGGPTSLPLTLKWVRDLVSGPGYTPSMTPPVFGRDKLFIGSGYGDSKLYALSLEDGSVLWAFHAPLNGFFGAPAATHGRVYAATYGNSPHVYALSAENGDLIWSTPLQPYHGSRASVAVAYGLVFVNTDEHKVYALDQPTGEIIWSMSTSSGSASQESSPAVGFYRLFVGSNDFLYSFRVPDGNTDWVCPLSASVGFSSPVVHYEVGVNHPALVFITTHEKLHGIRIANGSEAWNFTGDATLAFSSVAVAEELVFLFNFNKITALKANSGAVIWNSPTPRIPRHSPAVSNGFLYYSDGAEIHAVRISNGVEVWSASIPGNGDPNGPGNGIAIDRRLVVVPNKGHVYAFEG